MASAIARAISYSQKNCSNRNCDLSNSVSKVISATEHHSTADILKSTAYIELRN